MVPAVRRRYCSQENLALLKTADKFDHPHAPFYFRLDGSSTFVPSAPLSWIYPDDELFATDTEGRNYRSLDEARLGDEP